jgi:hypothetical protein
VLPLHYARNLALILLAVAMIPAGAAVRKKFTRHRRRGGG